MYFKNLGKALLELFLVVDRLGNALCGGYYETTVSGRVGYFALAKKNPYWLLLQWIIDETFRPIDGKRHCFQAYKWERERGLNHKRGNDVGLGFLSIFVIAACLIIAPFIWLWARAFPRNV